MKGKSKRKKTPLYEQYGFKTEAEFREKYPHAGQPTKKKPKGRNKARGIN